MTLDEQTKKELAEDFDLMNHLILKHKVKVTKVRQFYDIGDETADPTALYVCSVKDPASDRELEQVGLEMNWENNPHFDAVFFSTPAEKPIPTGDVTYDYGVKFVEELSYE